MLHWAKTLLFTCIVFLAPIKPLLIGSIVVTGLDAITGVMAARKRGERITSAGLRRSVTKSLIYSVAIVAGFVVEKLLLADLMPVSKLAAAAIGLVEFRSVLENAAVILGQNVFAALMSRLGSANDPRKAEGAVAPADPSLK